MSPAHRGNADRQLCGNIPPASAGGVYSDVTIYYQGSTSTAVGAAGECEPPYNGIEAYTALTDYISCPASYRQGSEETTSNREVGALIEVNDLYTNPATGNTQVWARSESDCVQYPDPGHFIWNRVYTC